MYQVLVIWYSFSFVADVGTSVVRFRLCFNSFVKFCRTYALHSAQSARRALHFTTKEVSAVKLRVNSHLTLQ